MKFELHTFWKHTDCMDLFLCVHHEFPHGSATRLSAEWMLQCATKYITVRVGNYWESGLQTVDILPTEYEKWRPYNPRGVYCGD